MNRYTTISSSLTLLYVYTLMHISTSFTMDPITITVKNLINDHTSNVQLFYKHLENHGVLTILSAPITIKCRTCKEGYILTESTDGIIDKAKQFAILRLFDPRSKEKQLELKITDNKQPFVIHDFDPETKKIKITKGKKVIASLTYPEK